MSVHPHACGEHLYNSPSGTQATGSSPRLWGTLAGDAPDYPQARFIPTPVGNTQQDTREMITEAVHPHACGEHGLTALRRTGTTGSSPRLWGTHFF